VKSIQGNSGEAQRLAQEALKLNPDYRPAMVTLARDHYRSRRLDLALYALKGILDGYGEENPPRDKNNAEAHLIRGLIYKEQGLRGPAITELQAALALRPDLVEARVQLSSYFLESGNAADAQGLLEPALKYDADNVIAHLNLGDAYRLLGRPADSKRELEWVKARDPSVAQVHYNLGLLYLFTDNFPGVSPGQAADTAIDELSQYKKMKPRVAGGTPDDTDELITRAKTKKALIDAKANESAAPDAAPAVPAVKPAETRAMAKSKLLQARAQLSQGNFDTAVALAKEVAKQKLTFTSSEDSPAKVLRDVSQGRQDPKLLLTAARSSLARKEFDQAEKFAKLADKAGSLLIFPVWGDTPASTLKEIAQARKAAPGVASKAAPAPKAASASNVPVPKLADRRPVPPIPAVPEVGKKESEEARVLIRKARAALTAGKVEEAKKCTALARAKKPNLSFWEDNPDRLDGDIRRAEVKSKTPATIVQTGASAVTKGPELPAAEAKAKAATSSTTTPRPSSETPLRVS